MTEEHPDRPVIRDKRRIDPVTGEPREVPAEQSAGTDPSEAGVPKAAELLIEERTRDLQRVQAEYANYRRRAERERLAAGDIAVSRVLSELLPVLDDIDRARQHGDLTGGLKAIAEQLELILSKLGLAGFGEVGDPFDPTIHEAVMHQEVPSDVTGISVPTCTTVMRRGYRHGERLLRAAMVGVSDPAETAEPAEPLGDEPADTEADE